jgi:hypothetical protein
MAQQKRESLKFEAPHEADIPGAGALMMATQAQLLMNLGPTRAEQAIAHKLRADLAMQVGMTIKAEHAERLAQTISEHTLERYSEFLDLERSILEKKRNEADQRDMEAFCRDMRQRQGNTLLAIRQAGINQVEGIVVSPLTPPSEPEEEVIIEQVPGLFGRLLGGHHVTRVRR